MIFDEKIFLIDDMICENLDYIIRDYLDFIVEI